MADDVLPNATQDVVPAPSVGQDTPAPAPTGTDSWNGEADHLEKRPWWSKLDESERADIKSGYEKKAKNLESGYTGKFQALADERKSWAAKEATWQKEAKELREEALFVREIFGGGSQEAKDVDAKLASLKKEYEDKYAPVEAELTTLREFKSTAEKREADAHEKRVQAEEARLTQEYGDILSNKDAAEMFARLVTAEVDDADAAEIVRRKHQIVTPKMPGAAANTSRGDSPAASDRLPRGLSSRDLIERAVEMSARNMGVK